MFVIPCFTCSRTSLSSSWLLTTKMLNPSLCYLFVQCIEFATGHFPQIAPGMCVECAGEMTDKRVEVMGMGVEAMDFGLE